MTQRVGDTHRNQVTGLLTDAVGEGYLDLVEYERRLIEVTGARTADDLAAQLADLPPKFRWDPRTPVVTGADRAVATRTTLALVTSIAAVPLAACYGAGALPAAVAVLLARSGRHQPDQRAKAVAATVIGSIGIALAVAVVIVLIVVG